ncbi:tetratricopeptide repeat-containing sensor histidine kinase [Hymenobacter antarcticus]|uniref:Tetratricopeptide repeat-containing protein n=1 Tax=Hymenobacter antarcticus TaxID=486270 RepID=A0ABP7P3U3_9BACT
MARHFFSLDVFRGWLVAGAALAAVLLLSRPAAGQALPELVEDSLVKRDRPWHRGASPLVRTSRLSQAQRIDSVRGLLAAHPRPDTLRVMLLTDLANEIMVVDVRAAGPARRAACGLARQVGYPNFVDETLLDLADYHIALAQYDSARLLLRDAQRIFTSQYDLGGQMRCLGRRARIADQQGHLAQALDYCLRAMAMSSTGDQRRFHTSLKIHAAGLYTRLGEYATARTYLREALAVARRYEYPDRINLIMGELGELARRQGQWAEARRYYRLSIAVSHQIVVTDQATVRAVRFHLADVTERLGQGPEALAQATAALRDAAAAHDVLLLPQLEALLGRTWLHLGRPDSALRYATRALQASEQAHSVEGLRAAYDVLARAHAQRRDWPAAYQAQLRFTTYDDSLTGTDVSRRTAALRFNHEVNQHRAQLQLLAQRLELDRLRRQRLAAGLLVLALLAGLGGAALLWRYRQRQRRQETALRNRLAADLHDDVGTLLSQISLQSSLLQEGLADSAGQRQQLGQISEASRSAVRQLNDVVWSLDAHNDHLPDLLDRMRDYAYDVLGTAGLDVEFVFPTELPAQRLPVLLRRNLYLIYKESLHNIIKHARGATTVTVRVRLETGSPDQLVLEIVDDGAGPTSGPDGHTRRSGHGLRNIQARAQALGGAAISGGTAGFRVCVVVPLPSTWKAFGHSSNSSPAA